MLKHRRGICFWFYFQKSKKTTERTSGEELPGFHPVEGSQDRFFLKPAPFQAIGRESAGEQGGHRAGTTWGPSNSQFAIPHGRAASLWIHAGQGAAVMGFAQLPNQHLAFQEHWHFPREELRHSAVTGVCSQNPLKRAKKKLLFHIYQ